MAFLQKGFRGFFNDIRIENKDNTRDPIDVTNAAGTNQFRVDNAGEITRVGGAAFAATGAELARVSDVSARLVTLTGNTTLTVATHEGKTLLLGEVGGNALLTVTLPAATGSGAIYKFIVSVVNTSNYVIDGDANGADFVGNIFTNSTTDTPDLTQGWPSGAANDLITLNGTTTGGQAIGDWVTVQDILTNEYFVTGLTSTSGTEATPFSGS